MERNLQNVANYLVASLAVADLFVACLVMPLSALYEVSSTSYTFNVIVVGGFFVVAFVRGFVLMKTICQQMNIGKKCCVHLELF